MEGIIGFLVEFGCALRTHNILLPPPLHGTTANDQLMQCYLQNYLLHQFQLKDELIHMSARLSESCIYVKLLTGYFDIDQWPLI
jgi:hypothetical protein